MLSHWCPSLLPGSFIRYTPSGFVRAIVGYKAERPPTEVWFTINIGPMAQISEKVMDHQAGMRWADAWLHVLEGEGRPDYDVPVNEVAAEVSCQYCHPRIKP